MHKIVFHLRDWGEWALGRDFSGSFLCCCLSLSHVCLLCAPVDCSPQVHPWDFPGKNTGVDWRFFLQGNLPDPRIEPMFLALAGRFFTAEPRGKPCFFMYFFLKLRSRQHGDSFSPSPIAQLSISHFPKGKHLTHVSLCVALSCKNFWGFQMKAQYSWLLVWKYSPFSQGEQVRSLLQGLPWWYGAKTPHPNSGGPGGIPVQGASSHLQQKKINNTFKKISLLEFLEIYLLDHNWNRLNVANFTWKS